MTNHQDTILRNTSAGPARPSAGRAFIRVVFEKYATLFLLVLLCIGFNFASERFLTVQNLTNLLVVQAVISCVAFAALIPLIAGEFDLSLGNMIGFLAMLGATLIFATDLHHLALMAIRNSYTIMPPSAPLMFGDAAQMAIQSVAAAFVIGVQMSAPFIVLGLVFYLGMGLLARMMPQLQVFFVIMPASIWVGLLLVGLLLTMMMGWYLTHFSDQLALLRGR